MNGPEDIQSTGFWQMVLNQCRDFAEHYNQNGGDATVIHLPDMGIKGNSHFMFQEMNNVEIADIVLTLTMIHPSRVRAEASPSISGLSFSCWGVL